MTIYNLNTVIFVFRFLIVTIKVFCEFSLIFKYIFIEHWVSLINFHDTHFNNKISYDTPYIYYVFIMCWLCYKYNSVTHSLRKKTTVYNSWTKYYSSVLTLICCAENVPIPWLEFHFPCWEVSVTWGQGQLYILFRILTGFLIIF